MASALRYRCIEIREWDGPKGLHVRFNVTALSASTDVQAGGEVSLFARGADRAKLEGITISQEFDLLPTL